MKSYRIFESRFGNKRYKIEEDRPEVGWYLYVYNEIGECIADFLQNDFNSVTNFALEEFQVPIDTWIPVDY